MNHPIGRPSPIRGKLAHGGVSSWQREHEVMVKGRIHEMEMIARSFLARVIFGLKPGDKIPESFNRTTSRLTIDPADPRNTSSVSDMKMLGSKNWKIKPEWID